MKTAAEILNQHETFHFTAGGCDEEHYYKENVLLAMEEYASQFKVSPERIIEQCRDELLKQLQIVRQTNGYPEEAVGKSTILMLPALMKNIATELTEGKEDSIKERIKPFISDEEAVVSKWIREDKEKSADVPEEGKEEDVYDQLSELHDWICEKMEGISQEMIDKDALHLGRYRSYKNVLNKIKEFPAAFKPQSVSLPTDKEIEGWANSERIDFGTEILIDGAKAMRDGKIQEYLQQRNG